TLGADPHFAQVNFRISSPKHLKVAQINRPAKRPLHSTEQSIVWQSLNRHPFVRLIARAKQTTNLSRRLEYPQPIERVSPTEIHGFERLLRQRHLLLTR